MDTKDKITRFLRQLPPHVRSLEAAGLLAEAVAEIDRLNQDREYLMRRLYLAAEVFAEIEAHPDRAERLAREAQFGPDAEPLQDVGENAELTGGASAPSRD